MGSATTWASVVAGNNFVLALRQDGTPWGWGNNGIGQLGDGTTTQRLLPAQTGTATWQQVAAGNAYSLGRPDGSLWATGLNNSGQLGDGTTANRTSFARVGTATWQSVATGATAAHAVAVQADGTLWTWGANAYGQTGQPVTAATLLLVFPLPTPMPVELVAFTAVAAGPAVRLAWASEKNSQAFEVERSFDGHAFTRIVTIAASNSPRRYELLDPNPPIQQSTLYYRLKQVDADGTFSYSPVRTVAFTHLLNYSPTLFPNPAHAVATLTGALPSTQVTIYDALGRAVATTTTEAAGTAALLLPQGLPAGVYVVRTNSKALRLTVE